MHRRPSEDSTGVHQARQVVLDGEQKAVIEFQGERSNSTFSVPTIAISKRDGTTYEVRADGATEFGPAPVPPTDIDDLAQTFVPPIQFDSKLKIVIKNTTQTDNRRYAMQVIGWEDQ